MINNRATYKTKSGSLSKNTMVYLAVSVLLIILFLLFSRSYRDLIRHTDLISRNTNVHNNYQNLSKEVYNAAVVNPDLSDALKELDGIKLFQADSLSVILKIETLKASVRDSINIAITQKLDETIRAELPWLISSNMLDSITFRRAGDHVRSLQFIDSLIDKGIKRTALVRERLQESLDKTIIEVKLWMILFVLISIAALFYMIIIFFRQRSGSERRFRVLVENSDDIIAMLDENMYPLYRSPSAERHMGYSITGGREDLEIMKYVHPADQENINTSLAEMKARPGIAVPVSYRMQHKLGHYIWLEGTFTNLLHDPNIKAIVANMREVTGRKIAEEKISETNQRFEYVTKATSDAIWDWDIVSGTFFWGQGYISLFGDMGDDLTSLAAVHKRIHPDDLLKVLSNADEVLKSDALNWNYEHRYLKDDGNYAFVVNRALIIRNAEGKALRVIGAMQDVSKQKAEEHHLKLLESVITNTNDAVLITEAEPQDEPGPRILYVNDALLKMTGYTREELIGKTPRILQGPETDSRELRRLGESLRKWQPCEVTVLNYKKNGEEFWINFSVSPVADENGWYTHWIAIERDVTHQKKEELQKKLLADISILFNETGDLDTTLHKIMERVAGYGRFNIAEAWLINPNLNIINMAAQFVAPGRAAAEQPADLKTCSIGEGLPGKTWERKSLQLWKNSQAKNGPDGELYRNAGLHTVYGLPVLYNHEVIGVFIFGSDSDEQKTDEYAALFEDLANTAGAEIKRKQLEQELNEIFSFAPDIISISGSDGYFKKINPAACELLEYTEEELLAVPFINFIHPEDKEKSLDRIRRIANGTRGPYFENRFISKSGKVRWLAWTSTPSTEEGLIFGVAKDITDKKELETLLGKANRLALLGSWEADLVKGTVFWSEITREIHEVDPDFVPTIENGLDFYKEGSNKEIVVQAVQEAITGGSSWDLELRIITAKGKEKWIKTIGKTEMADGKCVRLYGSFQDIDNQKKTEIELQHSIKTLKDYTFALDESSIIAITDSKGVILSINDNFCKISKYSREELIGNTHRVINSGYHSKEFFIDLWRTISSGRTWRGEIKNRAKDGQFYWVYTTITPFLDSNGKPLQYLAIRFDITEKKMAEEIMINALTEKNTILESIDDSFFAVDRNWIVTYWNNRAEKMIGKSKSEVIGNNFWDVFADAIDSLSYIKYHEAIETRQVIHFEDFYVTLGRWYEISAFPSENGLSVYFKDITERKLSEIRLNELNVSLQKQTKELAISNAELEQFAYVASHDLQEPLRMVTGFLTQLDKKYGSIIDEKGKKYIDFAVDGAKRMRQIILDLLEFSRVGRGEEDQEEIDLNELIDETKILFRKQIEEKKAHIQSADLPSITSFKVPLRLIFQNLIGNALKYTRQNVPAEIHINAEETADTWQFTVSDNGIGISPEYFDKIFIIFQRLHNKDEFSGTGMGLAICKKIVENLGGTIWIESAEGEGSTFYFTVKKQ